MTQFDARMGFAPALLCIEEEPLKKTATVTALKPHPKQKEFDAFAKGNHLVSGKFGDHVYTDNVNPFVDEGTITLSEYLRRNKESVMAQLQSGVFRGMHDKPENKTATEVRLAMDALQPRFERYTREMLENLMLSYPMPQPSGLGMLMDAERRQEKQLRHALNASAGTKTLLSGVILDNDGWFDGPPPCAGWWEASKSKHEGHYRRWDGSRWSAHATVTRDGDCSNEFAWRQLEPEEKSNKVKWRPFTPPWEASRTLVVFCGRPTIYVPSMGDPLCQLRVKEAFVSSTAYDRSAKLRMLTKEKRDAAAARLDAAINGKPIDPKNVSLADVNAKLSELSGPTLKFKRFKPQLTSDWGFDPAKADES